jgi:transcriptional regulator
MYVPASFREEETAPIAALMRENPFAVLTTVREGIPVASHLPFLVTASDAAAPDVAAPNATAPDGSPLLLRSHLARANPQWQDFTPEREVLTVFQGAHGYISPHDYATHPSVPTWNYAVVHAYGVPRLLTEEREIVGLLRAMVAEFEGTPEPSYMTAWTDGYLEKMARGIVAFEIRVTRLDAKFKLSQNRSETDQRRVIAALAERGTHGDTDAARLATLMQDILARG